MKYVKPGPFTTEQFSIDETITETEDVIMIATDIINKISNVPENVQKELNLAINNLKQADEYLAHIRRKSEIALKYVPQEIQEKEYL